MPPAHPNALRMENEYVETGETDDALDRSPNIEVHSVSDAIPEEGVQEPKKTINSSS